MRDWSAYDQVLVNRSPLTFHVSEEVLFPPAETDSLQDLRYTYDALGNVLTIKDYKAGNPQTQTFTSTVAIAYTYDPLYRLTAADYSDLSYFHYAYDAVGNRTQMVSGMTTGQVITTTYGYDIANRLTSVDGINYTWDANGNLLFDGLNTYTYDQANRLISMVNMPPAVTFAYNGLGDRVQQTYAGSTTTYLLDIASGITQVLGDGNSTYLYGLGLIGEEGAAGWQYHHGDALGSVRQLTDPSGAVTLAKNYRPYGDLLSSAGDVDTPYDFAGEWRDNTGLIHLRARYYEPTVGRFISRDPIFGILTQPGTQHPYIYARNNPVLYIDPNGEFAFIPLLLAAGAGGLLGGIGYYAIQTYLSGNQCNSWDWGEALFWSGIGTGMGVMVGVGIYGGWWGWTTYGKTFLIQSGSVAVPLSQEMKQIYWRQMHDVVFKAYPNLQKHIGQFKIEIHHRIPLQWAHLFPNANPNRLSNLYVLPRYVHRTIVNPAWNAFFKSNPLPSPSDVLKFAIEMDETIAQFINRIPK